MRVITTVRNNTAFTAHALDIIGLLIIIYGTVEFKREFVNKCLFAI